MRVAAVITIVLVSVSGPALAQTDLATYANLPGVWNSPSAIASNITIEKKVQEVSLILSVTDRKGHFVDSLQKSDLEIFDNSKQQDVLTFFQSQTDLPLDVAILFDVSSSVAYRVQAEQDTVQSFVKEIVRPRDTVILFAFNQQVELVTPVTNNWKQILSTLKTLKSDGNTALFDTIVTASRFLAHGSRPARRVLVVLTDGQENSSHLNLDATVAEVLKSEASVYAVNVDEDNFTDEGKQGQAVLRHLADATGGAYLKSNRDGDLLGAFAKIKRELRSQYAIAYRPSNLVGQAFHSIEITVPRRMRVRCRTGYYEK